MSALFPSGQLSSTDLGGRADRGDFESIWRSRVHDGLRGRTDGDGDIEVLFAGFSDPCQFGGKALNVILSTSSDFDDRNIGKLVSSTPMASMWPENHLRMTSQMYMAAGRRMKKPAISL